MGEGLFDSLVEEIGIVQTSTKNLEKEWEESFYPIKFYVATSFENSYMARQVMNKIEEAGHVITFDWTSEHKAIYPFTKRKLIAQKYSKENTQGILNCDVFVLLLTEFKSEGKADEFGQARMRNILGNGTPEVYLLTKRGEYLNNNLFNFSEIVKVRSNIEEIIKEAERNYFKIP